MCLGINAAIFFSTRIFESAGLDESSSQSATLGMGAMNVAMTFVSLVLIDRAGRKTLMITGLIIMLCMTTLLCISLVLSVSLWINSWMIDR
jgi:SP family facilitated glucose transporter-like MFS transporter 1